MALVSVICCRHIEAHDDGKEQGSSSVSEHVEGEAVDMSAM